MERTFFITILVSISLHMFSQVNSPHNLEIHQQIDSNLNTNFVLTFERNDIDYYSRLNIVFLISDDILKSERKYINNQHSYMVDTILHYLQFNLSPKDIVPFPDLPPDIDNRAIYSYLKINYITNEVIEYHGKLNFIWYEHLDNNTNLWLDYLIGSGKLDNENLIEIELTGYGKWCLAEIRNYSKEGLIKGDIFPKEPLLIVPRADYNSYN